MSRGIPIRPGCEMTDDVSLCLTHDEDWPCEPQRRYEAKPKVQVQLLREQLADLRAELRKAIDGQKALGEELARLTRIVEQAVMPFMRDVMAEGGGKRALQIDARVGDAHSLLGNDEGTFNRGHTPGTPNGITYAGHNGRQWVNGEPVQDDVGALLARLGVRGARRRPEW